MLKSSGYSSRGSSLYFQHLREGSQLSVALVLEDLDPLLASEAHMKYTGIHVDKTPINSK